MLATMREAAPRSGVASSVPAGTVGRGAGAVTAAGSAAARKALHGARLRPEADGLWRGGNGAGPVVGEELPPALADRVGIGQEAVVHVVDQPGVGAERAS